ncbi:MAG: EamA family transporter, partial [Janthinobacterium lividum]
MRQGIFYGVSAGALWGTVFVAPLLLPDFASLQMAAGRYLAYGLISLLIALPRARTLARKVRVADLALLVRLAITGNLLYYFLLSVGVQHVGIAPTSLIIGTLPVTITLASMPGRRAPGPGVPTPHALSFARLAAPMAVIVAGILCINIDVFRHGPLGVSGGWGALVGLAAALGALVSWTAFAVANARALQANPRFSGNEWSLLWGVVSGALGALVWLTLACLPEPLATLMGLKAMPAGRWQMFWCVNMALAFGASWLGNGLWNLASRAL